MTIRRISKYLTILFIGGLLFSCVPVKQFKEIEERQMNCDQERDLLKVQNERLVVDTTEMGAELSALLKDQGLLVADTTKMGGDYRRLSDLYDSAVKMNKDLSESKDALARGSAAEAKKLLAELQSTQEDLQRKEDELRQLERSLNAKKKSLDELQAQLEENNNILAQKNSELEERNARLIELEGMLYRKDSIVNALKDKVAAALGQFENDGLSIEIKNGKVYVRLEEKLLFKTGKWDVDPKGKSALKKLAKVLEQNPDISIMIEGHTDDVPFNGKSQIQNNWDLSVMRATAIVQILLDGSTIEPKRLTAAGRGEYVPVDPAKTAEARQKNRRTEIILTPKLDELFQILESN